MAKSGPAPALVYSAKTVRSPKEAFGNLQKIYLKSGVKKSYFQKCYT